MYRILTIFLIVLFTFQVPCVAQATPQRVAEGVISNSGDYCTTITADNKTLYFARQFEYGDAIMRSDYENNQWTEPKPVHFTGTFSDTDPLLAPDDKTLYFMTNRNRAATGVKDDYDIWAVGWDNDKNDWGEPYVLPDFINSSFTEGFPSVTANGTLYFFRANKAIRSDHDIWVSETVGGGFDTPRKVRGDINTKEWDGHPFVDANHEYMIYYSYKDGGYGSCDLYISFYENGAWGPSQNLGDVVNQETCEMVPFVTRNGKTLYFSRIEDGKRNIYQVDFKALKAKLSKTAK